MAGWLIKDLFCEDQFPIPRNTQEVLFPSVNDYEFLIDLEEGGTLDLPPQARWWGRPSMVISSAFGLFLFQHSLVTLTARSYSFRLKASTPCR